MVLIHKAFNLIERDALLEHLSSKGIQATSAQRDIIQNPTDNPNLSLGGYSAMFEGYEIFASEEQAERGRQLVSEYLTEIRAKNISEPIDPYSEQKKLERRFIVLSFLSFIVPLIPQIVAIYLLTTAKKKSIRISLRILAPSLFFLAITGLALLIFVYYEFLLERLSS